MSPKVTGTLPSSGAVTVAVTPAFLQPATDRMAAIAIREKIFFIANLLKGY